MKARLKLLKKTVISAIGKNPDIRLDELHLLCEKALNVKPVRFDASHVRVVASNNGLKWRGNL